MQFLPWQLRLDENSVLVPDIARRRRHDRAIANDDLASLPHRLTNVVLADEVGRLLLQRRFRLGVACAFRRWGSAFGWNVPSRSEELVDPAHTALLVVDMQRDFCEAGFAFDRLGVDISMYPSMIPRLARLIEAARNANGPG